MWIRRGEFEFDMMSLDLPQWNWIYRGALEIAVQGFPLAVFIWGGGGGGLCHAKIEKISKKDFVMIDKDGGQLLDFIGGGHSCDEGR